MNKVKAKSTRREAVDRGNKMGALVLDKCFLKILRIAIS